MSASISTIKLLRAWGAWGSIHLGYPRQCPMSQLTARSPMHAVGYIPADVIDIERAVGMIDVSDRRILVLKYQWFMNLRELGDRLGCTRWQARRKVERAEGEAESAYCAFDTNSVKPARLRKTASTPISRSISCPI